VVSHSAPRGPPPQLPRLIGINCSWQTQFVALRSDGRAWAAVGRQAVASGCTGGSQCELAASPVTAAARLLHHCSLVRIVAADYTLCSYRASQ
jgi:hypothetical protein